MEKNFRSLPRNQKKYQSEEHHTVTSGISGIGMNFHNILPKNKLLLRIKSKSKSQTHGLNSAPVGEVNISRSLGK